MTSLSTSPALPNAPAPAPVEFRYAQSDSFVEILSGLGASLLISTYQANKLLAVRASGGGLSTLVRTFDKPMGIAVDSQRLALGTRNAVWHLRNAPDIAPKIEPLGAHDGCYLPRSSHITGDIGIHEVAWAGEELWLVNTRFSCLCTLDENYSFVPRWRPPFISALAAEDRCHLNGVAMCDGTARFVSALGVSDTPNGWRANKANGGCLMEVPSGEFVARGLSMPHSPRWHNGRLWMLESGTGSIALVDLFTGKLETIARLPGFTRGLTIAGSYAFIGLSKIRPTSAMDGVPLAERRHELKCGVAVVDLRSGEIVAFLDFQTAVEELFDLQLLSEVRFPEVIGLQKDGIQHTFVIPPGK